MELWRFACFCVCGEALLMTAELLDAPDELYAVLAADPRAQLTVGQDAELTYGSDPAKIGKMRRVVVESVGDEVRVREGGKCRALRRPRILTLPRSVVYTRAEGAGVLLLAAAAGGATGVAVGLVRRGVHIGSVDGMLNSALHLAIDAGHDVTARALVAQGAVEHPLAKNARYLSPAHITCERGLRGTYRLLNPSPGDIDAAAIAERPLLRAAARGEVPAEPSGLDEATPEGCTALTLAAENGRADAVRALAAARADVNACSGVTPDALAGRTRHPALNLAARYADAATVRALVECRARPDGRDSHGGTALSQAASFPDIEMLGVLITARADVNLTSTRTTKGGCPRGNSPLHAAATFGHVEAIRALVAAGAHVNASTTDLIVGFQPLHFAMLAARPAPAVAALVEARAAVDAKARFPISATPLVIAAYFNNTEGVAALLAARADAGVAVRSVVVGFRRMTALEVAQAFGRAEVSAVLSDA